MPARPRHALARASPALRVARPLGGAYARLRRARRNTWRRKRQARLARPRARRAECASRKKSVVAREAVFFLAAQAVDSPRENAPADWARASGPTIFGYVGGNPLKYADPTGRFAIVLPLIPVIITGADVAIGAGLGLLGYGLDRMFNSPAPEPPVPGAVPHDDPVTGSGTRQWQKPGTAEDANRDFDSCRPGNVEDKGRGVRVGTLPNGDRIIVRPDSASGQPTIEIQRPDGKRSRDKVRYGP